MLLPGRDPRTLTKAARGQPTATEIYPICQLTRMPQITRNEQEIERRSKKKQGRISMCRGTAAVDLEGCGGGVEGDSAETDCQRLLRITLLES